MLDSLPRRSRKIILTNMRQSASLTLRILTSLYPGADLDAAGEGFMVTCSDEEALKLIEDSGSNNGTCHRYVRGRHVPRVDCDVITLSTP
jgi:hypothetical protein